MLFIITPQLMTVIYVVIALGLGAVIGLERELADRPAGLRTHMLVCGAAAFIVALGDALIEQIGANPDLLRSDPLRIVEAVVTGVSFLGAGTIFRRSDSNQIEGLTTAASLLFVAIVGICVATGQVGTAVVMTLLTWLVLRSGAWLESFFASRRRAK